jgi:hypothetical protein
MSARRNAVNRSGVASRCRVPTTRSESGANPRFARWLLLGTVLLLLLQAVVIRTLGEPYPAITMPAFPGAGSRPADPVPVQLPELAAVFADGSRAPVTTRELGPEISDVLRRSLVVANFGPDRLTPPGASRTAEPVDVSGWLPGRALMWRRRDDRSRAYWGREWLAAQCHRLFPSRSAVAFSIRWMKVDVLPDGSLTRPIDVAAARIDLPSSPGAGNVHRTP